MGDSNEDPASMDNHVNRPEVIQAIAGHSGVAMRFSRTLQQNMMYVATPISRNKQIKAVIRTSLPLTGIESEIKTIQINIALAGLIIAVLASGISLFVSRRISRPIEYMKQGAERFAGGELTHPAAASGKRTERFRRQCVT